VHPYRCRHLQVSALKIENPADSPNTDGLNPESCEDVDICGVAFSVGDDCIAIKAGKRGAGDNAHLAPCTDVTIRHCLMQFGHGAVVMGSEMSGDIRDVTIQNCVFHQTDRGLRLKTRRGRGGVIEHVRMENIDMEGVPTPVAVNAFYFCDADGKDDWVQSRIAGRVDETTPRIADITVANVTADGVTLAAAAVLGLPEAPVSALLFENFTVSYDASAQADVPLMALGVARVRHGGIIAEFCDFKGQVTQRPRQESQPAC
jgi:polygalacturonase